MSEVPWPFRCKECTDLQRIGTDSSYCSGTFSCKEWFQDLVVSQMRKYGLDVSNTTIGESPADVLEYFRSLSGDALNCSGAEIVRRLEFTLLENYKTSRVGAIVGANRFSFINQYIFNEENRTIVMYIMLRQMRRDPSFVSRIKVNTLLDLLAGEVLLPVSPSGIIPRTVTMSEYVLLCEGNSGRLCLPMSDFLV